MAAKTLLSTFARTSEAAVGLAERECRYSAPTVACPNMPPGLGKVHSRFGSDVDDVLHHHGHEDVDAPEIQENDGHPQAARYLPRPEADTLCSLGALAFPQLWGRSPSMAAPM